MVRHRLPPMKWLFLLALGGAAAKRCTKHLTTLSAGDTCKGTWNELTSGSHLLLPTQPSIGFAWVHAQYKKYFSSKKDAAKELKDAQFPVVLGGSHFYLTDHHHHAAALQLSGDKDIFDMDLDILVICDLRSLEATDFWAEMVKRKYVYLESRDSPYGLPHQVGPEALPTRWSLGSFEDNLWRSLAAFASHVDDSSSRCYVKSCEDFFVDFQWGYAINLATEDQAALWPSSAQQSAFHQRLHALPYPSLEDVELDEWKELGVWLLPLCHAKPLDALPLPEGFPSPTLQGWSPAPVPDDPGCKYEACVAARIFPGGADDAVVV